MASPAVLDQENPLFEDGEAHSTVGKAKKSCFNKNTYRTVMLTIITGLLFADQNLLAPTLSVVATEFNIPDDEKDLLLGGYLALGFFLVGAPISLYVGYLVDVVNRRNLFVITVVFGELACGLTYFAYDYETLFVLRALTGTSIGGALPLVMAMFGDMWDSDSRGKVSGLVGVAMAAGGGMGQTMASGFLWNWRLPFVIVSVPSILLCIIYYFTTEDPQRGRGEKALKKQFAEAEERGEELIYAEEVTWEKFKALWSSKTTLLMFFQGPPGSIPWGVMTIYFTDYLITNRGFGAGEAVTSNLSFGLGIILGQLIGGFLGDFFYPVNQRYVLYCMAITTILGVAPILFMINFEQISFIIYVASGLPSGILVSITGSNVKAILLNCTIPELRGTVFGIFNLFDDLGRGLGPFAAAIVIQSAGSREAGFNLSMIGWSICGFINFLASFTVEADSKHVRDLVKDARLLDHDDYERARRDSNLPPHEHEKKDSTVAPASSTDI